MIKLVYYGGPNFGDKLSPYIVHKLSGEPIQPKDYYRGVWHNLKRIIKYSIQWNFSKIKTLTWPYERVLLGIGSIIYAHNKNSIIWGSGFLSADQRLRKNCDLTVLATRGIKTSEIVQESGYNTTCIYGDPVMLLPLIYASQKTKLAHEIGIIPHYSELELLKKTYSQKFHVIDVTDNNIEQIIDQICSCKVVLSSSLHGIIVAHSYGIPAIWIKGVSSEPGEFKFEDYYTSICQKNNKSYPIEDIVNGKHSSIVHDAILHPEMFLPTKDVVKKIQISLLKCAPFSLVSHYQNILCQK